MPRCVIEIPSVMGLLSILVGNATGDMSSTESVKVPYLPTTFSSTFFL
jgi:hypothetical protein